MRRLLAAALTAVALLAAGAASASAQDSDAPAGALAHWLPNERWVYEHWVPFDEGRLHRLLGTTRGRIWRHLRDDAVHDLAQLARRRGSTPARLAARLVEPWARRATPARVRTLRARAYRVLTQGHLSQHILFHSLHQLTIPRNAQRIFGVPRTTFLRLRRAELSPSQIGRLHGRSAAQMRARIVAALRATARRGVAGQAITARQAAILLDRQLRQVPRWLGQRRYNGPPQTVGPGVAALPPADYATNPSISADGSRVVWDAYRARIPEARARGEIRVVAADLATGVLSDVSHAVDGGLPRSAYNSALSADGRTVVFEAAEGNLNFAKRYGEMRVLARALDAGPALAPVSHPRGDGEPSRTAWAPSLCADGRVVAYLASEAGKGGRASRNALWLVDRVTGRRSVVAPPALDTPLDAQVTADGRAVAFTLPDAGVDGRSLVYVRHVASGHTELVSRADGSRGAAAEGDAQEATPSADGAVVAFTTTAPALGARRGRARVVVRDLAAGTTRAVSPAGAFAFDPAVSPDGRFVAYAARAAGASVRNTAVWLHDRTTGATVRVSGARGWNAEPAVSADGARVAFTSTAGGLDPRKPAGTPGVFVRDLAAATTSLLSTHAPLQPPAGSATAGAGRPPARSAAAGAGGAPAASLATLHASVGSGLLCPLAA